MAAAVAGHVLEETETCRVLMEARALAAHEPAIAAAVRNADTRAHQQLEGLFAAGIEAGEWPAATDPALAARLFTAGLYGLMAQWHLAPGSFSWETAAAALAEGPAAVPHSASLVFDGEARPSPSPPGPEAPNEPNDGPGPEEGFRRALAPPAHCLPESG